MSMNQAGATPIVSGARRWDFLSGMMNHMGLKSFVEVGCKEGRTAGHILKTVEGSMVVAIDPWKERPKDSSDPTRETYQDWDFKKIAEEFWQNIGENVERCQMLMTTSTEAADQLKDKQFDIVFIDALHDFESVDQDIEAWWPIVREGGVLCGHDFNHKWPGVERAVAKHFDLMTVGIGLDSVWFVMKHGPTRLAQ